MIEQRGEEEEGIVAHGEGRERQPDQLMMCHHMAEILNALSVQILINEGGWLWC